jgi:hypothetical protein
VCKRLAFQEQEEVAGAREAVVPGYGIKYFPFFAEQSHFENELLAKFLQDSCGATEAIVF